MPALRVIFFGTAELARVILNTLAKLETLSLIGVVSQPDKPKGRALQLQPTPVKEEAAKWHLPIMQPVRARDEVFIKSLAELHPDLIIVAAYGQILPPNILELPPHGCLNVHTSLLPKYRGAAPIQWALLNGDAETGVTIMKMDAGMDTGDILVQRGTPITPADDAQTLHDRLARLGAQVLVETIPNYVAGKITPRAQPAEGVSYTRKISKEDGCINWNQPAPVLQNRVRAFLPWPGAHTQIVISGKSQTLKIWRAEVVDRADGVAGEILAAGQSGFVVRCGEQALKILQLQLEGGRRLHAEEFLRGHPLGVGDRLGRK